MNLLILSDIHGNQSAFRAVLSKAARDHDINACLLLGDLIDYGMHSNQVIQMVRCLPYEVICSIRGNHEDAIIRNEYNRFSSGRGQDSARYTRSILTSDSWNYISNEMCPKGIKEFEFNGKKCLAIHGSLTDQYWKSIHPEDALTQYGNYDYVFSGHSHVPHMVERYYASQDVKRRNKKKVIFINPGSVGQPRNLNNKAQFVVVDVKEERIIFEKAEYDILAEQNAFHGQVDNFYCERLEWGI